MRAGHPNAPHPLPRVERRSIPLKNCGRKYSRARVPHPSRRQQGTSNRRQRRGTTRGSGAPPQTGSPSSVSVSGHLATRACRPQTRAPGSYPPLLPHPVTTQESRPTALAKALRKQCRHAAAHTWFAISLLHRFPRPCRARSAPVQLGKPPAHRDSSHQHVIQIRIATSLLADTTTTMTFTHGCCCCCCRRPADARQHGDSSARSRRTGGNAYAMFVAIHLYNA